MACLAYGKDEFIAIAVERIRYLHRCDGPIAALRSFAELTFRSCLEVVSRMTMASMSAAIAECGAAPDKMTSWKVAEKAMARELAFALGKMATNKAHDCAFIYATIRATFIPDNETYCDLSR